MPTPLLWRISAVLLLSFSIQVGAVNYGPSLHQAQWHLQLSPFECRLWQPIPDYGDAVFSNRAGEQQRFYLQPIKPAMMAGKAGLESRGPVWDEQRQTRDLGEVKVTNARRAVSLGRMSTFQLLNELNSGMSPTFTKQSWYQAGESVEISMSSVHFRKAYREYQQCTSGLLPVNFDQVKRSRINFGTGGADLSQKIKNQLDRMILYVKTDPLKILFKIDGHSDSLGRRRLNLEVSKKRADAVTRYLVARGIDSEQIITRHHGERYPLKDNRTAKNRAANRRVTIILEREGDA